MRHHASASAQAVCAIAVALVLVALFLILNGRQSNMSANNIQYMQLFGAICNNAVVMARCACVACNSCTCACSCRAIPEMEEIGW
ncbi:FibroRumin family radical SAM-modified Cys-rich RiPP [Selenomonas sputigena]|uniref:FibroRumin family radical SAM-modified Cys-rich RiPP n=1 Tax=Selenomonas sputigena TaxID=69823 RepID=UPI003F681940